MKLKFSFFVLTYLCFTNLYSQLVNARLIQSGQTVTVYLVPTMTESLTLAGLNLTFNFPSGTTLNNITFNPYSLNFDNGLSSNSYTSGTGSGGNGISWVANTPISAFSFTVSGSGFVQLNANGTDFYYIQLGAINRTGTVESILPITLSTFSATQHSERSSRLNWSTSSEINSEYFGIERSTDGETWEAIDRIAAAGNSNEELAYELIDDRLPFTRSKDHIFYYRLRLTDLDGTFKYSDIQGVNFSRVQNSIVSIYPNPTNDRINVDLSGIDLDAGNIDLSVFDMTGRLLISKNITGNGIELIETQNLPTNIFNVVIRQGENIYQSRVIKIE